MVLAKAKTLPLAHQPEVYFASTLEHEPIGLRERSTLLMFFAMPRRKEQLRSLLRYFECLLFESVD